MTNDQPWRAGSKKNLCRNSCYFIERFLNANGEKNKKIIKSTPA